MKGLKVLRQMIIMSEREATKSNIYNDPWYWSTNLSFLVRKWLLYAGPSSIIRYVFIALRGEGAGCNMA